MLPAVINETSLISLKVSDNVQAEAGKRKLGENKEEEELNESCDDDDIWENMGVVEDDLYKRMKSRFTYIYKLTYKLNINFT